MMKRELAAAAVLALLIGISVWNVRTLDNLTGDIEIALCKSRTAAEQLDFRQARQYIADAHTLWLDAGKYTHCFISHGQISETSHAFYALEEKIAEEDAVACIPEFNQLKYTLRSLSDMERPSLGSIF